jgi:putative membrane protein
VTDLGEPIPPTDAPPPPKSKKALKLFLQRWVITTLAVVVAAYMLAGISYNTVPGLLVASLLLGIFNALFGRIKLVLGCLTLGVFALIMNALLLMFVGSLVDSFNVDGFSTAFWGGLVISLVSIIVSVLSGAEIGQVRSSFRAHIRTGGAPPGRERDDDDDDNKPVIDV